MNEGKIGAQHCERKAVLYVRQSSMQQVAHHQESRRLQYAMQQRLQALGWSDVEVVDDDLGRSGQSSAARTGFQRMVAQVCLGSVGAVAAREISRFARNNKDWHHLVELCRIFDTLLIDQDVIYDARRANDRLLLGVKGSLSEYELDLLRVRAHEARHEKAARGELSVRLPVGYVKTENGIEKDPDRRVQKALTLVFDKFLELGSARQTMIWFSRSGMELPVGILGRGGDAVHWKQPSYRRIRRVLDNPTYAGAYAYGKTTKVTDTRAGQPKKRIVAKPRSEWSVLLQDHHEGYIDWQTYERIQSMMAGNRNGMFGAGAVKRGTAMLSGILRCRRCGRRLRVGYSGRGDIVRYQCDTTFGDTHGPRCISFGGTRLDDYVSNEVLRVIEPASLESALLAAQDVSTSNEQLASALALELQEAQYAVDLAHRRYDAVDPANRLVADELESRWNAALVRVNEIEQRVNEERQRTRTQAAISRDDLLELAADLRSVWNSADTDVRLKKRVLRALITEIMVDLDEESNHVLLLIHWAGGVHTEVGITRPKRGTTSKRVSDDIIEAIRLLVRVCNDEAIAGLLNRNGLRTGIGNRWTQPRVATLRNRQGIPRHRRHDERWMTLKSVAAHFKVAPATLRRITQSQNVPVKHPLPDGPWIFDREVLASAALRAEIEHVQASKKGGKPNPGQLTLEISDT